MREIVLSIFCSVIALGMSLPVSAQQQAPADDEVTGESLIAMGAFPDTDSSTEIGTISSPFAPSAHRAGDARIKPLSFLPRGCEERNVSAKAVSSVADLAGYRVLLYSAANEDCYDGGCSVSIAAVEGTDSIYITDFYESDNVLKARIDITAMTISIPNQALGIDYTYGSYEISACSSSGEADRTTEISGTIASDGTITLSTTWGIFITEGDYAGGYLGVYGNTSMLIPNATMDYSVYSDGDTISYSFAVVATQTSSRTLSVTNYYNAGLTVDITLRSDWAAEIDIQPVVVNVYGNWNCYSVTYSSDYSSTYSGSFVTCDKASDNRNISWGDWNLVCVYDGTKYHSGELMISGRVVTDFDISYPEAITLTGDGTESNPYLISSAEEWNTLAMEYMGFITDSLSGKYVRLTDDIDFTGVTIKALGYDRGTVFNGTLDGNGHAIKGISIIADASYFGGIVNIAGTESYIHDVTVEGEIETSFNYTGGAVGGLHSNVSNITSRVNIVNLSSTKGTAGGVVGYAYEGGISGCEYSGEINSDYLYIGGILGYGEYLTMSDCVNRGTVTGRTYTGGIAGLISYSTVTDCFNHGPVNGTNQFAAGVVGYSGYNMNYTNCGNSGAVTHTASKSNCLNAGFAGNCYYGSFTDCYNTGDITAANSSTGYMAGLVASVKSGGTTSEYFNFTRCYNTGDVTGSNYVAGLIQSGLAYVMMNMTDCWNSGAITATSTTASQSYAAGLSSFYYNYSNYTRCYNTGDVTSNSGNYVGGLFAYYKGTTSSDSVNFGANITGCYNIGGVTSAGDYAAGITAYQFNECIIDSCYNTGDITAANYAAGVTARYYSMNKTASIDNCYSAGNISATGKYAGGIVAYCEYQDPINNCFNTGDVTASTSHAGGIAGYGAVAATNTYNAGTITGGTLVGGIIGSPRPGNYTAIATAYSCGKVVATNASASYGNIIGAGTDNTTYWKSGNAMSGTYYLTPNSPDGAATDNVSTGVSYAQLGALDLGDSWTAGDDYTYPRISSIDDNDYAKVFAAAIVPADGDSYSSITTSFHVGLPDGVAWEDDKGMIKVLSGGTACFVDVYQGTITMTATCGEASASTELDCDVPITGVVSVGDDTRSVVRERLYSPSGALISAAVNDNDDKSMYIVVTTYDDGSTSVKKEIR